MVRMLNYLIVSLLLFSCNNNPCKNNLSNTKIPFIEIKDESLIHEIRLYRDCVNIPEVPYKIVNVYISQYEDTTVYRINYAISAVGLIIAPSTYYSNVDGKLVAFSYEWIKELGLSDSLTWEFIKDYFPEEYKYYQENNDYPPPPTAREIVWVLKYKEGKLIDKKVIGP